MPLALALEPRVFDTKEITVGVAMAALNKPNKNFRRLGSAN